MLVHKTAAGLLREMEDFCEILAAEIKKPPSQRDGDALKAVWVQVHDMQAKMTTCFKRFRKENREIRKEVGMAQFRQHRVRNSDFRKMRQTMRSWEYAQTLVESHINPPLSPLTDKRDPSPESDHLNLLSAALHKMANQNKQSPDSQEHGCFSDIPFPINHFEHLMLTAYRILNILGRTENIKFLDVGCGGGIKLLSAKRYFSICDGLEYDLTYVEAAQHFLTTIKQEQSTVFEADGLTYDGYDTYDVIYFYRPMRDDDMLRLLELQVTNTASPHTVIVAPYDHMMGFRHDFPCARVDGPVFITGMTDEEASDLRAEAELTAPEWIKRSAEFTSEAGVWAPLLDAATHNGA